ncbi:MAG: purine-nucleoside phosphorylase [Solirubrobacteraceae bacterium]|jgi:DeoD family purine-nucleoside phosphorylase|nr:purine-nucleoside phosphorylase [Solirubrobacteraceae bacterium]
MPVHIHPTAPLARRVLLPGDPGRALALAQHVLSEPRMFNHNRGLWGYTGTAADGELMTIQSTGMGGPSAAIVVEELCDLGVERAIRVGTCGALVDDLELGDLIVADAAVCDDGTSRALGAGELVAADAGLADALAAAAGPSARRGPVATTDLFYDHGASRARAWMLSGALALEMEAATIFRVGELRGVPMACLLVVTDVFGPGGERHRIDEEGLVRAGERLGEVGAAALSG